MQNDILIFDAKLCHLGQDRFDEKVLFDPITNTPLELKSGPKIPFWKTLGQPDRIRAFVVCEHQSTVWKTQVESTHYANQSKVIVNLFQYEYYRNGSTFRGDIFRKVYEEWMPVTLKQLWEEKAAGRGMTRLLSGVNNEGFFIELIYYGKILFKRSATLSLPFQFKLDKPTLKENRKAIVGSWEEECREIVCVPIDYDDCMLHEEHSDHVEVYEVEKEVDDMIEESGGRFEPDGGMYEDGGAIRSPSSCCSCGYNRCLWKEIRYDILVYMQRLELNVLKDDDIVKHLQKVSKKNIQGRLEGNGVLPRCVLDGIHEIITHTREVQASLE